MKRVQSKHFMFTINNPLQPLNNPPIDFEAWRRVPEYVIYQLEIGENETPHLQGYICFSGQIRASTLRTLLGDVGHIEKRLGKHSQAKTYCSKEDTRISGPWIFGDDEGIPEGQGARTDMIGLKRDLDENHKLTVIADNHFALWLRYPKAIKMYKRLKSNKRNWVMEIITLIGGTGVGKTHWAYEHYGQDIYTVPPTKASGCYWDDYDGQDTVLVDEMYGNRFSHGFLLMLTDKYPFTVPDHGGLLNFSSKRIIFTSNADPDAWYTKIYESLSFFDGPLYRRLVRGNSFIARVDRDHSLNMLYFK